MAALEIEQKFIFEMKEIAKRLTAINATYLGQKTFLDTYYDFEDKKLALRNIWLRQRDSTWELKSGNNPKVDPDHLEGLGTTYYIERSGEESISQELDNYDFFSQSPTFSSKLSLLQPLAIIETTRTSYRLNDHTKVDLDQARLFPTDDVENRSIVRYSIGEIEIMVHKSDHLKDSHNDSVETELKSVRNLLGVETSQRLLSKIDKYFLEYRPGFYKSYPYRTFFVCYNTIVYSLSSYSKLFPISIRIIPFLLYNVFIIDFRHC